MEKGMEPLIADLTAEELTDSEAALSTVQLRGEIEQTRKELEQFRRSAAKCRKHMNYHQAALFDRRRRELAAALKALLVRLDKLPAGTEKVKQEATNEIPE